MSSQNFDTPRRGRKEETLNKFITDGCVSPPIKFQRSINLGGYSNQNIIMPSRAQRNVDIEKNNEAILLIEQQNNEFSQVS